MRSAAYFGGFALAVGASTAGGTGSPAEAQHSASGKAIYAVNCASCHGARGEAASGWDRPDATGEMPPPPHDRQGHTWKHSDAMLYRIVANGWRDPYNKTKRLTMPAFAEVLSPSQMREVVIYLKTLWTPEQQKFQLEESEHAPFPPGATQAP
ncbi:MAG: cytochrome c [Caldimonas sp.]